MAKETTEAVVNDPNAVAGEQNVTKERVDKLSTELQEKTEALNTAQQNNAILEANVRINAQANAGPPPDRIKDALKAAGLDPDDPKDMADQEQLHKILTKVSQDIQQESNLLMFIAEHPDYSQLVGTRDQLARNEYAPPLANAIKQNPNLKNVIASSVNPQYAAYQIAKQYADTGKVDPKATGAEEIINEAVATAGKVKSSANTTGGQALSEEGRYSEAAMSDEDFFAEVQKNGAQL